MVILFQNQLYLSILTVVVLLLKRFQNFNFPYFPSSTTHDLIRYCTEFSSCEFDEKVAYAFSSSSLDKPHEKYEEAKKELQGENLLQKFDFEKEQEKQII